MPLLTFDKVLRIILTILNVLSAALRAFGFDSDKTDIDSSEESEKGRS